jgi:hypothetical protein
MGKYFTVEVNPTITASLQTAAFGDADILFDWTAFDVPKGASRLLNATILTHSADGTASSHAVNLFFAKSRDAGATAPNSLGTINSTVSGSSASYNQVLGGWTIEETDQITGLTWMGVHGNAGWGTRTNGTQLVLEGEPESGTNVGYDKLYVAGISLDGDPTFASTVQCDGIQATTQAVLTVKTTYPTRVFRVGDILHDEDDRLLGTVKSVDGNTQMTMTANLANATVDNKDVYCINPIRLILQFEK